MLSANSSQIAAIIAAALRQRRDVVYLDAHALQVPRQRLGTFRANRLLGEDMPSEFL